MVVLLLVVGGLASLSPPPPGRVPSPPGGPFIREGQVASLSYQLVINPGKVGENTIEVVLSDTHGKPILGAEAVIVRLRMLEMDMGVQEADLHPLVKQPGHYATTDSSLSMAGQWQLTLLVRRTGFDEVNLSWTSTFH